MQKLSARWHSLPLAIKLYVTPVLAAVALAGVSLAGWQGLSHAQAAADEFNDARLPAAELVGDIGQRILQVREESFKVLTFTEAGYSAAQIERLLGQLTTHIEETRHLLEAQSQSALWTEPQQEGYVRIAKSFDAFARAAMEAVDMRDMGIASAAGYLTTADEHFTQLSVLMQDMAQSQRANAQSAAVESSEAVTHAKIFLLGVSLVGLLLAAGVAVMQARRIRQRLAQASDWAGRIAQGDLRLPSPDHAMAASRDDSDRLLVSLGRAGEGLTTLVDHIRRTSESVATAAQQIAQGNDELSQRTEVAAATLQQTHASAEQIRSSAETNAERARAAESLATAAAEVGQRSFEAAAQARETMQALSKQTGRITDLIDGIGSLAARSHLLSLNAAVEAARAGPAGRGFAVVASEVRTLANRSQGMASEIRTVISESVSAIQAGAQSVEQMHVQVARILEHSRELARDVQGISQSSHDQAGEVRTINEALAGLDAETQNNTALLS